MTVVIAASGVNFEGVPSHFARYHLSRVRRGQLHGENHNTKQSGFFRGSISQNLPL